MSVLGLVIEIDHDVQEALYIGYRSGGPSHETQKIYTQGCASDVHHWRAKRTYLGADLLTHHTSDPFRLDW